MTSLQIISWPFFFLLLGILAGFWLLTTKTRTGRMMIQRETFWTIRQWQWLLLALAITALVLVNPVAHLIGTTVLVGLYYLLVADSNQRQRLFSSRSTTTQAGIDQNTKSTAEEVVEMYCRTDNTVNLKKSKAALEQCLFSFPYIDQAKAPILRYLDGRFEISAQLSSGKYKASLVDYIRHAGFQIEYKN